MKIVADSTILHYLALIELSHILPELFGDVSIPQVIFQELTHQNTPFPVRRFMESYPSWLKIHKGGNPPIELPNLDLGESEAILLAEKIGAQFLLIDERGGRKIAQKRGLTPMGLLRVLELADVRGLINFPLSLSKLQKTNFRISDKLLLNVMNNYHKRNQLSDPT